MTEEDTKTMTGTLTVPLVDVTIQSTNITLNLTPWQAWTLANSIWAMLEDMLSEQRKAAGL